MEASPSMTVIAILAFLFGATLGQRFKVLVLLPAFLVAVILVSLALLVRGDAALSILAGNALAVVCLQLGYAFGIVVRATLASARAVPYRAALNNTATSER